MVAYETYEHLKIEVADKVALVVLNRPEVRNAMNRTMIRELQRIWRDLADDKSVHAVVLTGAGTHFSVGGDVKQMSSRPGGDFLNEGEQWDPAVSRRLVQQLLELDKPIVCAINGDAAGLAATIALFCDISVMADTARIGDPHVRVGLVAGDGGAVIWPLLIGMLRAKEYLLRGVMVPAREAERVGLVNYCLPPDQVLTKAREIAAELAGGATWAVRWTKLAINAAIKERANLVLPASYAYEHITMEMEDHKEAATAFKEKRKPAFKGR
ncbi:MAG: enoyl-CoA hydratase/isomerase family protein [Burkholderiales bacterium]|nr:enoyl-CoA hydratase/isomerase family protein [Burkholderiales bacterium]